MHLTNEVNDEFKIHKDFQGKLETRNTIIVDDNIKRLFLLATFALAEQFKEDGRVINKTCTCIFTDSEKFTLETESNSMAEYRGLCVFVVSKWSNIINNDKKVLGIILEELCHYYLEIYDEVDICYKVIEVAKKVDKTIQLGDIYDISEIERLKAIRDSKTSLS